MPSLGFIERLPFPTLKNYVLISFAAIGASVLFAWSHSKDFMMEALNSTKNLTDSELDVLFDTLTYAEHKQCLILAVTSQLWTICVSARLLWFINYHLANIIRADGSRI